MKANPFESGLGTDEWHIPFELLERAAILLKDDGKEQLSQLLSSGDSVGLEALTDLRDIMLAWLFAAKTEAGLIGSSTPDVHGQVIASQEEELEAPIHCAAVATAAIQSIIVTFRRDDIPCMKRLGIL